MSAYPPMYPVNPTRLLNDSDWNLLLANVTGSQLKSGSLTLSSGSNISLLSGSIIPFGSTFHYVVISGSASPTYSAINGATNNIDSNGNDLGVLFGVLETNVP